MTVDEFLNSESDIQPVRQMAYGPVVGEYHHAAMYGPNQNALGRTDVAASPDTGLGQGDLIMAEDGTLHTVADWSYLHPDQPTHKTIEFRDRQDQGHGFIKKVNSVDDFLGIPKAPSQAQPQQAQAAPESAASDDKAWRQATNAQGQPYWFTNEGEYSDTPPAGATATSAQPAPVKSVDEFLGISEAAPTIPPQDVQQKISELATKDRVTPADTGEGNGFLAKIKRTLGPYDQYIPEQLSTKEQLALEEQFSKEHPYIYGGAKALTGMIPKSWEDVKRMATLPQPSKFETEDLPQSEQLGEAWRGEHGPVEQAASIVGTALQAAPLLHLPFTESPLRPSPADLSLVERIKQAQAPQEIPPLLARPQEPLAPQLPEPELFPQFQTGRVEGQTARIGEVKPEGQQVLPGMETPSVTPAQRNGQILERRQGILDRKKELEARAANGEQVDAQLAAVQADLLDPSNPVVHAPQPVEVPVQPGEFAKPGYTAVTLEQAVKSGGTNTARFVRLVDGSEHQVAPFNPITPEGDIGLDNGNSVSRDVVSHVLDENRNPIHTVAEPPPPGAGAPVIPPEDVKYAGGGPQTEVPGTVGISQARTEAELGPGSVVPGVGAEMGSGLAHGRDYINKGGDPRLPIRRANTSGMVGKNDVGIVHAELDRLRVERSKAAAALEANPNDPVLQQNFSVADDAQRAWRKELQPVLTKASDALREAHAASMPDADVGTYQGLADLMDEHFKGERVVTPEMRTAMAKAARGVKETRDIANGEMAKVEGTLEKQVRARGKKVMTPEELEASIRNRLETEFADCVLGA